MKRINALLLALLLACSGTIAFAQDATPATPSAPAPQAVEQTAPAPTVKQLRGKLLYKRNQISKLEKSALSSNEDLRNKVTALENQRRDLLAGAQPRLAELYQQETELRQQIDTMSAKK